MTQGVGEVFKGLLLPIPVSQEEICMRAFRDSLDEHGLSREDHGVWTLYQVRAWATEGAPSDILRASIQAAVCAAAERFSAQIAASYFDLHAMLQTDFLLSHTQASAFLSHLRLIYTLADEEWMSSAQIANLVGARDSRVGVSRQSIGKVLRGLRIMPRLTLEQVRTRFAEDSALEAEVLADADLETSAILVGTVAESLGCQIEFGSKLLDLCPEGDLRYHPPYVQMLHYQATIAEFYDHRLTDLYEFMPRGRRLLWLMDQYPDALSVAGNPFLNNAKSVEALTIGWARSKEATFRSALALFDLLAEMEELGFSARKELAQWVRLWIHRVMRLARPLENLIPEDLNGEALLRFLNGLSCAESRTSGILEQRVVDALTYSMYPKTQGWVARGLGDPVNATNRSKRKLGDIDFQNLSEKQVVAFEAHAGTLTGAYLQDHLQVFWRVLDERIDEWATYSASEGWTVDIIFVGHAFSVAPPDDVNYEGVTVSVSFWSYEDLLQRAKEDDLEAAIRSFVIQPVNGKNTPNHAREALLTIANS